MVLPPVVAGVALFYALGRRGLVGQYLDRWFGITLPFTTAGVIVAQTFVAMPFLVITVEAAFRQLDTRYEEAARTLGASRWYVFRRVTLPAIRPGLIAGAVLAWARALGEFGATITFAGNFPGRTQTMPLAIYIANEVNPDEAIVLEPGAHRRLVRRAGRAFATGSSASGQAPSAHEPRRTRACAQLGSLELDVEVHTAGGETSPSSDPTAPARPRCSAASPGLLPIDEGLHQARRPRPRRPHRRASSCRPNQRPVGVVFQDYLLFPNLTALENVAFGLRARGVPRGGARQRALTWLRAVGLADHAALGRARCRAGRRNASPWPEPWRPSPDCCSSTSPSPRSTPAPRSDVRRDLRRHLATFDGVRLLVTHDPVDAYALADRVVILEAGRVVQTGTLVRGHRPAPVALHRRPRRRQPAERHGRATARSRRDPAAGSSPPTRSTARPSPSSNRTPSPCIPTPPDGSPRNVWAVTVADIDRRADRVRVRLVGEVPLVAEITPAALDRPRASARRRRSGRRSRRPRSLFTRCELSAAAPRSSDR